VTDDFMTHVAPLPWAADVGETGGREALEQWISGGYRPLIPDMQNSIDVGPIADDHYMVVRWKVEACLSCSRSAFTRCRRGPNGMPGSDADQGVQATHDQTCFNARSVLEASALSCALHGGCLDLKAVRKGRGTLWALRRTQILFRRTAGLIRFASGLPQRDQRFRRWLSLVWSW
jgi:hypothetical protein